MMSILTVRAGSINVEHVQGGQKRWIGIQGRYRSLETMENGYI